MHFKPIKDFSSARILISNDDGIEARGIKLLENILKRLGADVWVVAPNKEKSGASHAITSDTLRSMAGHSSAESFPNVVHKIDERHFAVEGTPTDCIRIAMAMIMKDKKPDLLVSGINNGRNIADDITYSGTIGVAIEGLLHGVRSLAVSQLTDGAEVVHWNLADIYLEDIVKKVCAQPCHVDCLININFPNVPAEEVKKIVVCRHGTRRFDEGSVEKKRMCMDNLEGVYQPDSIFPDDDKEIHSKNITISALSINLTNEKENLKLAQIFA